MVTPETGTCIACVSSGVKGSWWKLAGFMGGKPECAVFRKFRRVNALKLLEIQTEFHKKRRCIRDVVEGGCGRQTVNYSILSS